MGKLFLFLCAGFFMLSNNKAQAGTDSAFNRRVNMFTSWALKHYQADSINFTIGDRYSTNGKEYNWYHIYIRVNPTLNFIEDKMSECVTEFCLRVTGEDTTGVTAFVTLEMQLGDGIMFGQDYFQTDILNGKYDLNNNPPQWLAKLDHMLSQVDLAFVDIESLSQEALKKDTCTFFNYVIGFRYPVKRAVRKRVFKTIINFLRSGQHENLQFTWQLKELLLADGNRKRLNLSTIIFFPYAPPTGYAL